MECFVGISFVQHFDDKYEVGISNEVKNKIVMKFSRRISKIIFIHAERLCAWVECVCVHVLETVFVLFTRLCIFFNVENGWAIITNDLFISKNTRER